MNYPKPTHLKLLEGNPGHRPINENEPQPEVRIPECPDHLDQKAKTFYETIAPQLLKLGVLTEIDGYGLGVLSQLLSDWNRLERSIRREGLICKNFHVTKEGKKFVIGTKTNPKVIMKREILKLIRAFLAEFGMTPSSRTRIKVSPEMDDEEFEGLLTRVK